MSRGLRLAPWLLPASLSLLSACGGGQDAGVGDPVYEVVERFEVGSGIYVRALAIEEATNTLWVGTSMGVMEIGLDDQALRNTFTRQHGLANEYVFAIGIDSQGYKWFGTNAGGASRYKDGEWDVFFPMHGLADYWIYAFAEQRDAVYWVGTWDGANRVDLKTMEFTKYKEELINEWVYGLAVDSKNRVWFGTEGGVSMLDGDTWSEWNHDDGIGAPNDAALPPSTNTGLGTRTRHDLSVLMGGQESYNPNYVFATHADPEDVIWVGTWGGGVSRYEESEWRNLSMADGLAGNIVYSIAQDDSGAYWFGTNRGISRYDGDTFTNFDSTDGLPGNHVYAIAVADNGDVWVGTRDGVARLMQATISE
jgi:ligand-binding sensor domain-containing protein